MNAGQIPTMPDGLPQPQPVSGDIDPLLRLMRENQQLTEKLKAADAKIVEQRKIYEELRIHAGHQLEKLGKRFTLAEQARRRLAGQATTLARCLSKLYKSIQVALDDPLSLEKTKGLLEAGREADELLSILPPEMK